MQLSSQQWPAHVAPWHIIGEDSVFDTCPKTAPARKTKGLPCSGKAFVVGEAAGNALKR
jgi:hypothetical protein